MQLLVGFFNGSNEQSDCGLSPYQTSYITSMRLVRSSQATMLVGGGQQSAAQMLKVSSRARIVFRNNVQPAAASGSVQR